MDLTLRRISSRVMLLLTHMLWKIPSVDQTALAGWRTLPTRPGRTQQCGRTTEWAQTMGDAEDGAVANSSRIVCGSWRPSRDRRCGSLVEEDDLGILDQGTGERDERSLTHRQVGTLLLDDRVEVDSGDRSAGGGIARDGKGFSISSSEIEADSLAASSTGMTGVAARACACRRR